MADSPNSSARVACRRCPGRVLAATLTAAAALVVCAAPASTADRPMRFDHLTIRDGLSQSAVLAMHQDRDGFLPSPLIVCAAVAARTTRLKVGTSVILLPLYHPIHLAEDFATLDIVSHGRSILGVGLGYQPADFNMFNVPRAERVGRFEEGVEIIRRCWTGERRR